MSSSPRLFDFGRVSSSITQPRYYIRCFDSALVSVVLTSVAFSFMSTVDLRCVCDSSDNHPVRGSDVVSRPFRQGHVDNAGEADSGVTDCSAPSSSGAPPSGSLVVVPVNVTEYIDNFRLFLDAWLLAVMHRYGDRLDDFDVRVGGRNDTALGA